MHRIGKIDRRIYSCITDDIAVDEVVITDERMDHIRKRHPGDYEKYMNYLPDIIGIPDYILKDSHPNTALVLKEIFDSDKGEYFRLVLKLKTSSDDPTFKNSIITFMKTHKTEYERLLRNKKILYKRE